MGCEVPLAPHPQRPPLSGTVRYAVFLLIFCQGIKGFLEGSVVGGWVMDLDFGSSLGPPQPMAVSLTALTG